MKIGNVSSLCNRYRGESLFMVGNGSSLTYDQLDAIRGHYSWAMNNISLAFPYTDWRPTFYSSAAITAHTIDHHKKCAEIGVAEAEHAFVWSRNINLVFDNPHEIKGTAHIISCHSHPLWSSKADREVSRYGNSIFVGFQIGLYMGFRHYYLIGCDMHYIPWDDKHGAYNPAHFCPDYSLGKKWDDERMRMDILRGFQIHEIALTYIRRAGGEIWNCTPGSLIKTYPRKSLEEALNELA